ncbi:MAG: hypothetical protein QOI66_1902 [Myxococcales bacterium]|jgi:uncharacterized protein (UPF0248 family)|nr:hypothetical protein [Myxococcales bacterium]HXI58454.1 hypothetical protein [Polyangia bacterium]
MTREIIVSILESEGIKAATGTFTVREDREATCFVSAPGDVMPVSRIVRIELKDKSLVLETSKDERFHFAYEDILGFKLATTSTPKDRHAGFGR